MIQKMIKIQELALMLGLKNTESGKKHIISLLKQAEEKNQIKLLIPMGRYQYVLKDQLKKVLPEIFTDDSKLETEILNLKRKNAELTNALNRIEGQLDKLKKEVARTLI